MQQRHYETGFRRNILLFCMAGLVVAFFVAAIIVFNPNILPLIDSYLLQAPCCMESGIIMNNKSSSHQSFFNLFLYKLIATALKWTNFSTCNVVGKECFFSKYRRLRCHARMDGLHLDRFLWWNQFRMTNFTLHSIKNCNFYPSASQNYEYLSPMYLFGGKDGTINVLESSSTEIESKSEKKPALQIQDLSINLHSIFEPVIDINASGVTINVVTENDVIQIAPAIEIPLTVVRVGDWTLDELFAMIPSPPKEEGFPKLGIVNISHARILSHTIRDDVTSVNEIFFPDEFFYPLFQLTSLAGVNGTDRTIVSTVIQKSIVMVLRKHAANRNGFVSKTMESFLSNLQKSSEFMSEVSEFLYDKVQEWTGLFDDGVGKVSRALDKFITKVELDLQNAMQDESNPFSRLSKEAKFLWEGIDESLSKAGYTVANVLGKIENELGTWAQNKKDFAPKITDELKYGWDAIKESFREMEDDLRLNVHLVEENLGQVISEVTKDAVEGMNKAKQQFHSLFDELNDGNTHKEL